MSRIRHRRSRKLLLFGSLLLIVLIPAAIFLARQPQDAKASWWKGDETGSWLKRKKVPVVNNSTVTLSADTTIAITINTKEMVDQGKLKSDCSDLRVLYQPNNTTATNLPRFISYPGGGSCATAEAAKIHFSLQASLASSATSADYYIYFGNPDATTPTDSDSAFDIGSKEALLVCPFNGTTTCAAGETPSTESGAIRYSGSKSALSFENNDYINTASSDNLTAGDFTIEAWINPNDPDTIGYQLSTIFGARGSGSGCDGYDAPLFFLHTWDALMFLHRRTDGTNYWQTISNPLVYNTWNHVSVTYSKNTSSVKIFINGILKSGTETNTPTLLCPTTGYNIGSNAGNNGHYYSGQIDEFRLSNVVRYTSNFTPQTTPFIRDEFTKLLLHFDENGDDPRNTGKAIDDSGNGNHGTITGAKYVAGLVGVDNGFTDTGKAEGGNAYAGREGVFMEEGATNKILNPSFEHSTYSTNWSASASATLTDNTSSPYYKFGSHSAKMVVSGGEASLLTDINTGNTNLHTLSAYVYDGTSGNTGGTVSSTIATLMAASTPIATTYTDMGGGWWRLHGSIAGANESRSWGVSVKDGKTCYIDGMQLEERSSYTNYATSYMDGSLGTGYSWTSTEHNSTSSRTTANIIYNSALNTNDTTGSVSIWYKPNWNEALPPGDGYERHAAFRVGGGGFGFGNGFVVSGYCSSYQPCTTADFSVSPFGTGSTEFTVSATISRNNWYHIAYIWNGSTHILYVNNVASSAQTFNTHTDNGNISVGGGVSYADSAFSTLADMVVYDDALTSTEVADIYHAGLVSHSNEPIIDRFGSTNEDPVAIYHFDEGFGSTIRDSSLNGNHLTSYGATWNVMSGSSAQSVGSRSLAFDGTNDSASSSASLTGFNFGTRPFSVSGWFRHSSSISGTDTLISQYTTAGYKIYMNSSGFICAGIDDDSTWGPDDETCSTTSYADSKWHHVEMVKGSTTLTLYVDGNAAGSKTITATGNLSPGAPLFLGADNNSTNYWDGFIDELYVYSYARSADQVKADYSLRSASVFGTSTYDTLSDGLVGYWKMDESSGNAADSGGNGYTLTNNGTTTFVGGKFGNGSEHVPASVQHFSTASTVSGVKSISLWVNPDSTTNYYVSLTSGAYITSSTGTLTATGFADPKIYVNGVASTTIAADTWQLVTVTTDTAIDANQFYVGRQGDNYFDGTMDEARIYNRALSPAEVQKLYEWAPGPVAYWKMDEGAGQYAYDISGNSNTVTLGSSTSSDSADPQWVAGKFGSALNFINNTNYATLASSIALSGDYTISFWAQPTGTDGWEGVLGGPTSSQGYINLRRDSWGGIRFDDGTGCGLNTGSSDGGWINISVVMNNSGSQFYVNGVSKGTCTSSAANFTFNQIGRFWNNTTTYGYGGNLDNIIVYNYARTPAQIIEDMNAGHPAPGSPVGSALIHYTFDEGYGTTANNKGNGGSALNGTITSGTWTNEGQFGKALTFTASTSVTKTITDPGNTNTISVWVYPTTSAASKTLVTSGKLTTDSSSRPVYGGCTGTALALDTWTHIVAVSNGASSCTIYQNGNLTASGTTGVTFGTSVNLGGTSFTGRMDEFKLYNLAMSADQVKVEFNQGQATTFGANTAADGKTADLSASRDYCVPGDTSTCNPPVGEWKFDEKTGTSANDTSDNNLTGSITGATWTNGKHGGALNFNGSTDVISVADNALVDLTTDATFTAWVYPTSISGAHNIIQKDESNGYAFYLNDGQVCLWNANDTYTCAITTLTSNRWHHVAAVKSDSAIYIYQDGILVRARSATAAFPTNGLALGIGARVSDLVGAFPGKIDEVRIFNYPRSRAQIAWEMNRGQPLAWYRFEECQGTTANNVMGNAHHGTINPGSSGNTAVGTCTSGNTAHMWFDGATGKYDASLGFDGTDDTVTVADDYALRFDYSGQCFSLLAWVKRDSTGSLDTIISKEDAANDGYSLKVNADNTVSCTLNATTLTSTHTLDTNWHHVACTINRSGTGQIYINGDKSGAAVDTSSITMATTATLTIGARSYTPAGTYFGGLIDDLRLYNYSLTEPLVRSAMNYGSTRF
jgi:hypothetical protein